ncbi:MAG: glycosyltransferase family 4 protein [Desulfobulbaceae bacterium]|nr:glycosyltransferase family 4 protein [Desulfobulbaceae bacterium]
MTMPVLGMVLKGYPRISETFISNEILLLEQLGMRIRIFSMRHPREPFSHDSVKKIQARVDYLPTELFLEFPRLLLPTALEAVRQPSRFLDVLRMAGERFARTRSLGTIKHLMQGAFLVNRFLRSSPEVAHLHAHFAHSPASVALFASRLGSLDFSFTAHAKDIYTSNPDQIREKISRASFVVTCTEYNRQFLANLAGAVATSVYRVYHGIDLKLFTGHDQRRRPRPPYRILSVARLTAKKGIPTILEALAMLRDQGVQFQYILIGDGDERDRILGLIFDLGLQDSCRWTGTLPHEQVVNEFARADLFALGCEIGPDGDRDGIPNVLVESLAMGLPAVGTWVSALPEIIINNETGLLSKPGDPRAMADNMHRLLTDEPLRQKVISAGLQHVRAGFNNRQLINDLAAIYCRNIPGLNCL